MSIFRLCEFAPQIAYNLGIVIIFALRRLLDYVQEMSTHGKSSSEDVQHPKETRYIPFKLYLWTDSNTAV